MKKVLLAICILLLVACDDDNYLIDMPDLNESSYVDYTLMNGTYFNTLDMETLSFLVTSLNLDVNVADTYFSNDNIYWRWDNNLHPYLFDLETIQFTGTNINDQQLNSILDLHNLQELHLNNENDITTLPEGLSLNLPLLEELYIHNLIDLTDIPDLPNESLTEFHVTECPDLSNITPSPFTISSLEFLYLYDLNDFALSIPSDLDNLTQLEHLSITGDNMTGVIPDGLFTFENLSYLRLCNSQLSGTISENISILEDLEYLYLYDNNLSGEIPANIVLLDDLRTLDLSYNLLTGNIPADLFLNASLYNIYLSNNNLSGDIPDSICDYISDPENYIDIGGNNFCTYIPDCFTNLIGGQNCD